MQRAALHRPLLRRRVGSRTESCHLMGDTWISDFRDFLDEDGEFVDWIEIRNSGSGSVNLDAVTRKVTVVVQWDDSRAAGGSSAQQTSIETRL